MAELAHGTAIAVGGCCALLRGPSGSGKSDLALRCLALAPSHLLPEPAALVADDQVLLTKSGAVLVASCPPTIAGRIEVRGIGIFEVAFQASARLVLVIDLTPQPVERYPDPLPKTRLAGVSLPLVVLPAFEPSAPIKLLMLLHKLSTEAGKALPYRK